MFYGMVVDFHLFREVFLQPQVFINSVLYELDCLLPFNLYRTFSFIPIVEPSLCPPSYTCTVGIDRDESWYIKCLDIDIQLSQWVNNSTTYCCFGIKFFFTTSSIVDR